MAHSIPYFEVGIDPQSGQQFCLMTMSGMRQFKDVLTKAIDIFQQGLKDIPENDTEVIKTEVKCGNVHVVFMTDNSLGKIMNQAKAIIGLPPEFNPWMKTDGTPYDTALPGWLDKMGLSNLPDEDAKQVEDILTENDPED